MKCFLIIVAFLLIVVPAQARDTTRPDDIQAMLDKAQMGDVDAQYELALIYVRMFKDTQEAVKWFQEAAEQGHRLSQNELGKAYYFGSGVKRNYEEALFWFLLAASNEEGNFVENVNLTTQKLSPKEISTIVLRAKEWREERGLDNFDFLATATLLAGAGDADAQFKLGRMYNEGTKGASQNYDEAVKWFRKAAEQGHPDAMHSLGWMYRDGHGVEQDYKKRAAWWRKAAEHGSIGAQYNFGLELLELTSGMRDKRLEPPNFEEGAKFIRATAEHGDQYAQDVLGGLYAQGKGVMKDFIEAAKWYRRSAEQGNNSAQSMLASAYLDGRGVPQSYEECYFWSLVKDTYRTSMYGGLGDYGKNQAEKHLTKEQISEIQKRVKEWKASPEEG